MKKHPYHSQYSCDENGSVYGPRGKLKPISHHTGYHVLTVGYKQYRWHRFIWECHFGLITDKTLVINHKDGDKTNNHVSNLELVTSQENTVHAFANGLRKSKVGEDMGGSKITNNQCRELISLILAGKTNKELGKMYNLHPNYVSLIRHRKRWRHLWKEFD